MLVVDASVLVHAVADAGAIGAAARQAVLEHEAVVPDVADVEVVSILRRWNLSGDLSEDRLLQAAANLRSLEIERLPTRSLVVDIVRLRHDVTAYDGAYLAIAHLFDVPLLTRDAKLSRAPNLPCRVDLL